MTFINVALRNHPEQHREQPEQQKKGNHILTVIAAYPNPIENIVLKPSKWTGNAAIQSLDFGHKKKLMRTNRGQMTVRNRADNTQTRAVTWF